jgi:hypothetical protein
MGGSANRAEAVATNPWAPLPVVRNCDGMRQCMAVPYLRRPILLADNSIDVIVSNRVFEHIDNLTPFEK